MPLRRIRDAGGFRQGFRRLGPAILELVEALGAPDAVDAPAGRGAPDAGDEPAASDAVAATEAPARFWVS